MQFLKILIFLFSSLSLFGQTGNTKLTISRLTGEYYVYTTYKQWGGTLFPSNSMYLVTNEGIVLFDTPWDTTQFQPLLDSLTIRHQKKAILCIATHSHDDRTAGLQFFKEHGVKTYTSKMTRDLCKEHNEKQAEFCFVSDTLFNIGGHRFETYYPGEGHTRDNIVIWIDNEKILYGGCFIKSTESNGLGNIADANLNSWGPSIENVIRRYPVQNFVIPGHFGWTNNDALRYTIELLKER